MIFLAVARLPLQLLVFILLFDILAKAVFIVTLTRQLKQTAIDIRVSGFLFFFYRRSLLSRNSLSAVRPLSVKFLSFYLWNKEIDFAF